MRRRGGGDGHANGEPHRTGDRGPRPGCRERVHWKLDPRARRLGRGARCSGRRGTQLMGRRLAPLTLDNLPDVPKRCRSCVFWELDPVSGEAAVKAGRPELEKEAWISGVLLEWGS